MIDKVDIFLEQREVAFLSPSKVCENLNFSTVHPEKFKFLQILLGNKNATFFCTKIISTLTLFSCLFQTFWLELFKMPIHTYSTVRNVLNKIQLKLPHTSS